MRIALDYDGTYTADPLLWNTFIRIPAQKGHEVICVTMRHEHEEITMPCAIFYTGRQAKIDFMQEHAPRVDIWIDDSPKWLFSNG